MITLGSLFDGSGTAPLAAAILGWTPVWASEIEPYPIAVTKARFPNMKHLGDITEINGAEIEPVDVIVGGSPCQDLSVAGKQAGLENGTRSNLFYEMTRIIREMRESTNGMYPRFAAWENVFGALSSNQGRDFHEVVKAFCALADDTVSIPEPQKDKRTDKLIWRNAGCIVGDGWSFAWRVLDAQHWGVPQRRRRIFAVLDFGSERAGEILFERTRLPWDSEPRGAEGQAAPADAVGRADRGGGAGVTHPEVWHTMTALNARCVESAQQPNCIVYPTDVTGALCARADSSPCVDRGQPFVAMFMGGQGERARGIGYSEKAAHTLKATPSGGNTVPDVVYALQGNGIDRALTAGCNGAGWREGEMYTLNTIDRPAVVFAQNQRDEVRDLGNVAGALNAAPGMKQQTYVAYAADCRNGALSEEISGTLQAKPNGGQSLNCVNPVVYDARGKGSGDVAATITGDHQNRITDYTNIAVKENDSPKLYAMQAFGHYEDAGVASAQLSRNYKDATDIVVERKPRRYIVRRLTPTECARLQGFPDWWVDGIAVPNPTDEDIAFWAEVWETHRKVMNPEGKPKTRKQIIKWLSEPGSDSNEYKMWGNGMALPCMLAVLNSIKEVHHGQD